MKTFSIKASDMEKCPIKSFSPSHYREDGTCKCGSGVNDEEVKWSRNHFDRIKIGGIWAVPRSGLIFTKKDEQTFELTAVMPYLDEMKTAAADGRDVPESKEDLVAYQRDDFDAIAKRFNRAGITMTGRERIK